MLGMFYWVRNVVIFLLQLLQIVLVVYCVLSWFADPNGHVAQLFARAAEPVLRPVRSLLSRGARDRRYEAFAPVIAVLLIQLLSGLLRRL